MGPTTKMAAAVASTRTESSKIDSAGMESGEKMLVGLIANGPPGRACGFLRGAGAGPAGTPRRYGVKLTTAPVTPAGRTAAQSGIPPRVPAIPPSSLAHGRAL